MIDKTHDYSKEPDFKATHLHFNHTFFNDIEYFLTNAVFQLSASNSNSRLEEIILIYIPSHISAMWFNYCRLRLTTLVLDVERGVSISEEIKMMKFMGINIIDNYDNSIVVALKDGLINKIEPIKMQLS